MKDKQIKERLRIVKETDNEKLIREIRREVMSIKALMRLQDAINKAKNTKKG